MGILQRMGGKTVTMVRVKHESKDWGRAGSYDA